VSPWWERKGEGKRFFEVEVKKKENSKGALKLV
jgi:hypothetical protein